MSEGFEEEYQKLKALGFDKKECHVIIDLLGVIIQTEVDSYFDSLEAAND